ncbi:hypothetical protein [Ornithinimicrobium kibberense]|uniref:hypothetical protein n=1 Tax=Ornithinimicrobium kibberense TaxID=282060 RepID=UPI00360F67AF
MERRRARPGRLLARGGAEQDAAARGAAPLAAREGPRLTATAPSRPRARSWWRRRPARS